MSAPHATPLATDRAEPSRLQYLPALDGLRAVAVVLVLLFHQGFAWMRGGFLGVSVFFTLSGYLITSLLLHERASTGGVALGAFWRRRFRRLLPASLVAVAVAIAYGLFAADATQRADLGGDVVASLAYVANWWFLATDQTYGALFSGPSPLLHFWSLAIEEQFYLVLPLVVWATFGRRSGDGARNLKVFAGIVAVTLVATVSLPFVTGASDDWLYFATPARLPEMLTGVVLAMVFARGDLRQRLSQSAARVVPTVAGLAAIGIIVALSATSTVGSAWLYQGGFAAFSLVSVALIVAIHAPHSIATRLLATAPLVYLGKVSYGIYLYHWPIFLWLSEQRVGFGGWGLFAVRMVVTLCVAELSYRIIEGPIRTTGRISVAGAMRPMAKLAPVAIVALIAAGLVTSITAPPPAIDFDAAEASAEAAGNHGADGPPPTLPESAGDVDPELLGDEAAIEAFVDALGAEPPPARLAVYGDSTAMMLGFGMHSLSDGPAPTPSGMVITEGAALMGCGIGRSGERRFGTDTIETIPSHCLEWENFWRERSATHLPNVAAVLVGPWDVMDRRVDPAEPFRSPGDPQWDQWLRDDMLAATDLLTAEGAYVLWLTSPLPNANLDAQNHFAGPEAVDPARFAHLNSIVEELPSLRPGKVGVIDFAGWVAAQGDEDLTMRPDGVHLSRQGGESVANNFMADAIEAAFASAWERGDARRVLAETVAGWEDLPGLHDLADTEPLRVAVWSDERIADITAALPADVDGRPIDVTAVAPPDCGVSTPLQRRISGTVVDVSDACRERRDITTVADTVKPHVVVVAPGMWEASENRPWPDDDRWQEPTLPFNRLWLLSEFASALELLRDTGSVVVTVDMGAGPPSALAEGPDQWPATVDNLLANAAQAPGRSGWVRHVSLATTPDAAGALNDALLWASDMLTAADDTQPADRSGARR